MAAYLIPGLIKDALVDLQYNTQGALLSGRIDRSYYVGDVDSNAGIEVQAVAVGLVQLECPVGEPHPLSPLCVARGFRAQPVASDNSCEVIVSFIFQPFGGGSNATEWTVSVTTGTEEDLYDTEFTSATDSTLLPIRIPYYKNWLQPNTAIVGSSENTYGSIVSTKSVWNYVYQKTITEDNGLILEAAIPDYLNTVNDATFRGRPAGMAFCQSINVFYNIYDPTANRAQIVFRAKKESFQPYVRVTNTQYGTPYNIWKVGQAPANTANGYKQTIQLLESNFDALLSLI